MEMNLRYEIDEQVRALNADSGAILLHLGRGTYSRINPIAMQIWRSIERGLSAGEILVELQSSFAAVGAERLEQDLARFLAQLTEKGLARVR